MTASDHSAGGQALGYVHQCLWALIELGRRAADDPAVELRLEALDDIQFEVDGSPVELLQSKHSIGEQSTLTAMSVQLWRSLNVWMDAPVGGDLILRLVTTSAVVDGSGLAGLRADGDRNVSGALASLLSAARESSNSTTRPWRERFLALGEDECERLVERIYIDDGSPRAVELSEALESTFRYAAPAGKREVFNDLLVGQWASLAVRMLSRSLSAITGYDLVNIVADISDQLKSDNLPVDLALIEQSDQAVAPDQYRSRLFVQQLMWIAADDGRLLRAIRDYHRSFTLRSYWLRYQLTAEIDFDRFAFELHDEWEQVFESRVAAMRREGRLDAEAVGQEILEELARESRARLKERFDYPWFNRGMFHALADGELNRQIGWHPDFEEKLEAMLVDVVS